MRFARRMVSKYPDYRIVVLDKLTYAGNLDNLLPVKDAPNYALSAATSPTATPSGAYWKRTRSTRL